MPVAVIGKPQEWFVFDADAQLRFRSREQMLIGEELPERKFLLPRQEASYLNPYGQADLAMCFWPATFKRGGLKFWVTFTEKYGTPWLVGKTPRNTPDNERDKLLDQLDSMVQDAVAVIPDDSSVDIIEGQKTSSAEIYRELLMYCRSEISIALLGQNQTTEAEANRASATAGAEVTHDIRDGDVGMIVESLNELIRWILELNTGSSDDAPTFEMWEQQEVDDKQAKRDEVLSRSGVVFSQSYFERSYDLRPDDFKAAATVVLPPQDATETEALAANETSKYDASMINAYLGVDTPVDFVRSIFGLPEPKPGQSVLSPIDSSPSAGLQGIATSNFAESSNVAPHNDGRDGLDDALDDAINEWQPLVADTLDPIQKAFDEAVKQGLTAAELIARLPELLAKMPADELQERLARAAFAVRLAAKLGVKVAGDVAEAE